MHKVVMNITPEDKRFTGLSGSVGGKKVSDRHVFGLAYKIMI